MAAKKEEVEPKLIEIGVSASVGGKVQVKKYEIDSSYYYSMSGKWDVTGMDEAEAEAFREAKLVEARERLEPIAQAEADDLLDQRKASGT